MQCKHITRSKPKKPTLSTTKQPKRKISFAALKVLRSGGKVAFAVHKVAPRFSPAHALNAALQVVSVQFEVLHRLFDALVPDQFGDDLDRHARPVRLRYERTPRHVRAQHLPQHLNLLILFGAPHPHNPHRTRQPCKTCDAFKCAIWRGVTGFVTDSYILVVCQTRKQENLRPSRKGKRCRSHPTCSAQTNTQSNSVSRRLACRNLRSIR